MSLFTSGNILETLRYFEKHYGKPRKDVDPKYLPRILMGTVWLPASSGGVTAKLWKNGQMIPQPI